MTQRRNELQILHDKVIEIAASNFKKLYKVYTNPNTLKNTKVGNLYPDLILTPLDSNSVSFIIEVETSDSVTAHEAFNQWADYSKIGGTFYLLVPSESRSLAETLCKKFLIQAKFATYRVDANNHLQINYE